MNMTKGKKTAIIGFCIFLGFMAACTVTAKGIYRAGLPRIITQKPYGSSLTHLLTAQGIVKQRQEYALFVESGLRVATVSVKEGDEFVPGQQLFQIDIEDLQTVINEKQLELNKLKNQQAEDLNNAALSKKEQQLSVFRAKEDYEAVLKEADALIAEKQQALEAAQWELTLYDRYIAGLSGGSVSGGDADTAQYQQQLNRHQLVQAAVTAAGDLESAMLQKEEQLTAAERAIEDAQKESDSSLPVLAAEPDIAYRQEALSKLEQLLNEEGWIAAKTAGQVLKLRISAGERTPDEAAILYAEDDGRQIIEALFTAQADSTWSPVSYIAVGTGLFLQAKLRDGSGLQENVPVTYINQSSEGLLVQLDLEDSGLLIGQTVELSCRVQTENYDTCLPISCLYLDENNGYYVYVAEEREGILGTQWQVRMVRVTVEDKTSTIAAVSSVELTADSKVVSNTTGTLTDGAVVRLVK